MAKKPEEREFTSVQEAVVSRLVEPIWYVDTAEAVKAPYEPTPAAPSVALDPKYFRSSD